MNQQAAQEWRRRGLNIAEVAFYSVLVFSAVERAVIGKAGLGWGYPFLHFKENEEPEKFEGDGRTPAVFFRIRIGRSSPAVR